MKKIVAQNKKASFDYEILEEFVAGIMLTGAEVKSVRAGHINVKGAYITVSGTAAWLKKAHISQYKFDGGEGYDPLRDRKLLLKKKELDKIEIALSAQGISVVPLAVFFQDYLAKVTIGLGRGRKKVDKRNVIREREIARRISQHIKHR